MKDIIQRLFNFIASLWSAGKKFLEEHGKDAIDLVNKVKEAVNSPTADAITKLIPGTWDDIALAWARAATPIACEALEIIIECPTEDGPAAYFECVVDHFRQLPEAQRAGAYRDFAAQLSLAKAKVAGYEHGLKLRNVNLAIELEYNRQTED